PDQMRQVLINLLRNAFSAVESGGKVRIVVDEIAHRPRMRVWDSAGGIRGADLPRVFEPFFTTREGGTGLGLSMVHSIVRAHGGLIHVTSSPEQGMEFTIELPARSEERIADLGG